MTLLVPVILSGHKQHWENSIEEDLVMIELQSGAFLHEGDIFCCENAYGRA